MLVAGELNNRVDIEEDTGATFDGAGQPVESWGALAAGSAVPAEVMAVGGGEMIRGRQVAATARWLVIVRHRTDITAQMRLDFGGNKLYIMRPPYDPDGRRDELRLECAEEADS